MIYKLKRRFDYSNKKGIGYFSFLFKLRSFFFFFYPRSSGFFPPFSHLHEEFWATDFASDSEAHRIGTLWRRIWLIPFEFRISSRRDQQKKHLSEVL